MADKKTPAAKAKTTSPKAKAAPAPKARAAVKKPAVKAAAAKAAVKAPVAKKAAAKATPKAAPKKLTRPKAAPAQSDVKFEDQRCGFIALLGAPNAGKSTLMNQLTGRKLSIVSPKPQTTRRRVMGIMHRGVNQIVFVDLPGVFTARRAMDRAMVAAAWEGARDADLVIMMVDASLRMPARETKRILQWLENEKRTAILALNKIDAIPKEKLLGLTKEFFDTGLFSDVVMISAINGDGCDRLMELVTASIPAGPWQYPHDSVTDLVEREWASEITREQTYYQLEQELPYAIAVETDSWKSNGNRGIRIEQTIYVSRPTQRAIVLGDKGSRIKEIGRVAREEMQTQLGRPIHLFLNVKVKEDWMDNKTFLARHGLYEE